MKILITGGAGFIGSNLVSLLLEQLKINKIIIYDNLQVCNTCYLDKITDLQLENELRGTIKKNGCSVEIELVKGDILNSELLTTSCKKADVIVHLAAHTQVVQSVEEPRESLDVNIIGTVNVLESARINNINNVVIASSNAAVGDITPPIDESILPQPISPYGAGKLSSEALGSAYAKCYGITVTALRFANAYGSYSQHKTSVIAKMLKEIVKGNGLTVYGDGNQTRDFINASDIAKAIWLAMNRNGDFELFQVASGKEMSINGLIKIICSIADNKPDIKYTSERIGEIKRNFSKIDKIQRKLNFKPKIDLEEGIKKLYHQFAKIF